MAGRKGQAKTKTARSKRLAKQPARRSSRVLPKGGARHFSILQLTLGLGLLTLVIVSGVQVANQAHEVRRLHATLETMGKDYDALLAENSRLTLERGARASYAEVEKIAADRLAMHFPDEIMTLSVADAATQVQR